MESHLESFGYCQLAITSTEPRGDVFQSNNERAFVLSQLHDMLSPRIMLGDIPAYRQLASCIDLLAFSLTRRGILLLIFTIDTAIASDFAHRIAARLADYQYEYGPSGGPLRQRHSLSVALTPLSGAHHALASTLSLHSLHPDWEFDRYSSIGFYLHDRRGDWMRTWRVSQLYENSSTHYEAMLRDYMASAPAMPSDSPVFPLAPTAPAA